MLGWLGLIGGAIAAGGGSDAGWLVTLFFDLRLRRALLAAWVARGSAMAIREGPLPLLPKRKLRQELSAR